MAKKVDKTHPKSFANFIMEAIDEVAPARGAKIYWLAFNRYEDYAHAAQRRKSPVDEWAAND